MLFKIFHRGLGKSPWDNMHSYAKLAQEFFTSIYAQCLRKTNKLTKNIFHFAYVLFQIWSRYWKIIAAILFGAANTAPVFRFHHILYATNDELWLAIPPAWLTASSMRSRFLLVVLSTTFPVEFWNLGGIGICWCTDDKWYVGWRILWQKQSRDLRTYKEEDTYLRLSFHSLMKQVRNKHCTSRERLSGGGWNGVEWKKVMGKNQ